MSKRKISTEEKLKSIERCLQGQSSIGEENRILQVNQDTVEHWIEWYQCKGEEGMIQPSQKTAYSTELKYRAVGDYLSGKGSLRSICKKYKIRSTHQLRNWIKLYNGHKELKCYAGGSHMTEERNTTYEERIALVKECTESGYNYTEIAKKHKVGYQQIYT